MTLLNQIVAVEAGVRSTTERSFTDAYHTIQKDASTFSGIARTYTPRDDEGEHLPPESTKVQQNVEEIISGVTSTLVRLFDVTLTKDKANTTAKADVVLDGVTLVRDAPVPYLLFLEKRLGDLRTFIGRLPTLDPASNWTRDPQSGPGIWAADEVQTTRSVRQPRTLVKYEATVQHPAQVEVWQENVVVGTWTTKVFSGNIPRERQSELLGRVDRLAEAVKMAREAANTAEVTDYHAGRAVLDFLFA